METTLTGGTNGVKSSNEMRMELTLRDDKSTRILFETGINCRFDIKHYLDLNYRKKREQNQNRDNPDNKPITKKGLYIPQAGSYSLHSV
ncbi:hypothetical protein VNO77_12447 [Canavalia gladiata]|uniref:Uncharacterized protein n=1 Tax=Canavalia gladiata TaxID=3824 RepID=A0AAN9QQ09_CANGL